MSSESSSQKAIPNDDGSAESFWTRYEQLKSLEGYKNTLIEEILCRYQDLSELYKKECYEHEREREYNRNTHGREKGFRENIKRLQTHMDRGPFVLVLIDGNRMLFKNELLDRGEQGGMEAAARLLEAITNHIDHELPELPSESKVVTRIYANVKALAETCYEAGIVDRRSKLEDFVRGFTAGQSLFDFVDVASEKDVDDKLLETSQLYLHDYHCRQIFFGSSHGTGYARLLDEVAADHRILTRVTILEDLPMENEIEGLPVARELLRNLFQVNKINMGTRNNGQGAPLDTLPNGAPSIPSARAASISSGTSAKPSPTFTWAAAVQKPAPPIATPSPKVTPTKLTSSTTVATTGASEIPRNRKGQRIDPPLKHDKDEVDRIKKLKICNVHFLRGPCSYGKSCTHVHDYKPSVQELQMLRFVARMAPCREQSGCEDPKCIYGHVCPAPEPRSGGGDCIFGDACRFPSEMHGVDRRVAKVVRV